MTDDIISVIDERIRKKLKASSIQEARILNIGPRFAKIQIAGSAGIEDAFYDISAKIEAGDYCLVAWSPQRNHFVVLTAFNAPGSQTNLMTRRLTSMELAPPSGVEAHNYIPGTIIVEWNAPPQQAVAFEIQTNTTAVESGSSTQLVTRGSYAIVETSVQLYARVRSISSDFEYSSWSPWVTATPDSALDIGTILRLIEYDFTYLTSSPLALRLLTSAALATAVRLIIDTAFDGTVSLTVGEMGNTSRLMSASQNVPSVVGSYDVTPDYQYSGGEEIRLYLSVAGSTQGAGRVLLWLRE